MLFITAELGILQIPSTDEDTKCIFCWKIEWCGCAFFRTKHPKIGVYSLFICPSTPQPTICSNLVLWCPPTCPCDLTPPSGLHLTSQCIKDFSLILWVINYKLIFIPDKMQIAMVSLPVTLLHLCLLNNSSWVILTFKIHSGCYFNAQKVFSPTRVN